VSGKTGAGVAELLERVVQDVPAPVGDADAPARAMIFDSVYDSYRGVVTYVRVIDGHVSPRERIVMMSTKATHELLEIGVTSPEMSPADGLGVGEVGYLITGVKDVRQSKVGDTVTSAGRIGLSGPTRCARQAEAQRRRIGVRAGDLGCARVRLSMRVSRFAAYGDRS
jgi:GTP-binding protein LepA